MKTILAAIAGLLLLTAGAARAEVVSAETNGAVIRQSVTIRAPAARVWEALIHPSRWWDSGHTFSGAADNLYIDLSQAGCLCERTPGGGHVRHLSLVYFSPGQELRFEGGMGPMQTSGTTGHMSWTVREANGVTTLTWTYALGGYFPGGIAAFAPAVDGMLGQQVGRLKTFVETGRPG